MENASNSEKAPVSLLSQARIAAGLSLQQLTEITRIPARYLQALESHDYAHFPSNLFVIGYLRNCADVLAVDINALLEDYDLEELQKSSTAIDVAEHTEANRRYLLNLEKHHLQWLLCSFVTAVVVILMVFLIFVGQYDLNNDDHITHPEQDLVEPVVKESEFILKPADSVANEFVADEATSPTDVISQSGDSPMDKLADDVSSVDPLIEVSRQARPPLAVAESEDLADEDLVLIELAFNGASWVDLTDATGQRVYRDLVKKESKLAFSVAMPLELLLGDARQVKVFLNGQPFAIQSYRDDNSVRLMIDLP